MACLAGFGFTGRGTPRTTTPEQRTASAAKLGNKLFVPALTIPAVAMACAIGVKHLSFGASRSSRRAAKPSWAWGSAPSSPSSSA